jgi:hypothetical protein
MLVEKTRTQANGTVERFNRTLINMLAMYCQKDQKHWDEVLPQVMLAYRASVHSSIGVSPNEMFLGRNVTMSLEAIIPRPKDPDEDDIQHINEYIRKIQRLID